MRVQTYANDGGAINAVLRHSAREYKVSSNPDVDPDRSKDNYFLLNREDPFTYYKERLSEVYCYNRRDVKTLCEWIVNVPKDTPQNQEHAFFKATYDYLIERFCMGNERNVVLAVVHKDEKRIEGKPIAHMHFFFLPITADPKHKQGEKICKKAVLPKSCFTQLHPELQKYIESRGIQGTVHSGITAAQKRNYSVEEIKDGTRDRIEAQYQQFLKKQSQVKEQQQQEENFFTGKQEQEELSSWFDQTQEEAQNEDQSWL